MVETIDTKMERKHFYIAIVLILVFVSPMFILGEQMHVRVHDNLDSNVAWYKTLVSSGELFGSLNATLPQVMNGLPRAAYASEYTGIVWLYALFPPILAYAFSQTITRLFAFLGMYLLLRDHFVKASDTYLIRIYVALAFAITPFWPSGMLATLGMPLALWAFLNIRQRKATWREWLTLFLLPFYSSFVLGFFFFLVGIGLLWLYDLVTKRKWNFPFLASIFFMTAIFCAIEYRLLFNMVFSDTLTNRNEFWIFHHDFFHALLKGLGIYILGHNHVYTIPTLVLLPLAFINLWMIIGMEAIRKEKTFIFLFLLDGLVCLWFGFWSHRLFAPLKENYPVFRTFNFARFHFTRPMFTYLVFAVGARFLWDLRSRWRKMAIGVIIAQLFVLACANPEIVYRVKGEPTFGEFYSTALFQDIKKTIDKPQESYRVISLGIHPAIAQYNGFYTLDSYANFYPITYKRQFRQIIEKELEKNRAIRKYYDHWGGRCYAFSAELGKRYDYRKNSRKVLRNLELNTTVFKEMGGRYVLSAVPISNATANQLRLVRAFENSSSVWKIYLYEAV